MSRLLIVLATDQPIGDFGFCAYKWTPQEQRNFLDFGIPPKTIDWLPPHTEILPLILYARDLECTADGPNLTAPQFRRLNSSQQHRLIIWDLWGPDDLARLNPLVIIPSEDLQPTPLQRDLFEKNLRVDKKKEYTERTPLITSVLDKGLLTTDYIVGSQGPLSYGNDSWDEVWELFDRFLKTEQLQHPEGQPRNAVSYRCPLWKIHERLVEEDLRHINDDTELHLER